MAEESKVYIDGDLVPKREAKISVYDHGLLYGDGVFEGIRVYGGRPFRLAEHLERLYRSAQAIWLKIPMETRCLAAAVRRTVKANRIRDGYVRLVVTRGCGTLGLDPNKCPRPSVIIIADTITLYPEEYYRNGLALVTVNTPRINPAALSPQIKSLNYLNNIMAKIDGLNAGCVEAVMLNSQGYVAECTGDNIFIVRSGRLRTPPESAGILVGITRQVVMEIASRLRIRVEEVDMTKYDLYTAEECFLCGTAAEIVPVAKIDGRAIGGGRPGKITLKLLAHFRRLTKAAR